MRATVQAARSSADLAESCADEAREEHPPDGLIRVRVREVRELADHLPVHDRTKRAKLLRHLAVVTERNEHLPRHAGRPAAPERSTSTPKRHRERRAPIGPRRLPHGGGTGPAGCPSGRHLLHVRDDLPRLDRGRALGKADVLRSLWQRVQLARALGEQRKLLLRARASSTPLQARRTHTPAHTHTHTHSDTHTSNAWTACHGSRCSLSERAAPAGPFGRLGCGCTPGARRRHRHASKPA